VLFNKSSFSASYTNSFFSYFLACLRVTERMKGVWQKEVLKLSNFQKVINSIHLGDPDPLSDVQGFLGHSS
jgi:hypothetical protein